MLELLPCGIVLPLVSWWPEEGIRPKNITTAGVRYKHPLGLLLNYNLKLPKFDYVTKLSFLCYCHISLLKNSVFLFQGLIIRWMQRELGRANDGPASAEASSAALSLSTHMKGIFSGLLICLGFCLLVAAVEAFSGCKRTATENVSRISPGAGVVNRNQNLPPLHPKARRLGFI